MKSLGDRIRQLRVERNLSQKALAQILKVGQTTIANYESNLRQPNIEKLKEIADYFEISLDSLLCRKPDNRPGTDQMQPGSLSERESAAAAKTYVDLLIGHRKYQAVELILMFVHRGVPCREVYENVLIPAMHRTGELWSLGVIDVGQEHYITEVTRLVMAHIVMLSPRGEPVQLSAVVTTATGENHVLAGRMIADCLEVEGYQAYFLGHDVPLRSLIETLRSVKADILVISVTMKSNLGGALKYIQAVREHPELAHVKIILGGQAIESDDGAGIIEMADRVGTSLSGALDWIASELKRRERTHDDE